MLFNQTRIVKDSKLIGLRIICVNPICAFFYDLLCFIILAELENKFFYSVTLKILLKSLVRMKYYIHLMENFALIEKIVPQIYICKLFYADSHAIIQNILFAFTALSLLYEGFQSESRDFKSDVGILRPQR